MVPIEYVEPVIMEDWSEDYVASEHWNKYRNAMSAPWEDEWPEGFTEDGDKLFLNDKLLVPQNRVEALIYHSHNAQLMHPGRHKMQRDLDCMFEFPPGYYAIINPYFNDCAVCRAMINRNHSTAGSLVYTEIPEAPMCSIAMDVFAMPKVTIEEKENDCITSAVD